MNPDPENSMRRLLKQSDDWIPELIQSVPVQKRHLKVKQKLNRPPLVSYGQFLADSELSAH